MTQNFFLAFTYKEILVIMNGTNAAAIFLWVLIVIIVILIIVWIACECSKNSGKDVKVVSFGQGNPNKMNKKNKNTPRPILKNTQKPQMQEENNELGHPSDKWDNMEKPFAMSHGGPMDYAPYGANSEMANTHAAHGSNFPTEESPNALYPKNPPVAGADPGSVCAPAGDSKYGYNLNVNHLMPASWRGPSECGVEDTDSTQWAAYAPSKAAFDSYITTAGSSRLAVNTRTAQARQTGLPNLLKDMVQGSGGPPVPIGANAVTFNDSDFRQTLVYNSVGSFPEMTWC